ncbi:DUF494 family protein [Balneolales bacterium ANBcel1]|nr:DUF494 family protein [Balneolales bacterium ANBcel1]
MRLKDISLDRLKGYNKAEISAAYSWLMHKYENGEISQQKRDPGHKPAPRVLHPSERIQISPEAYGYLLDLYYLGILDASEMERLIEIAVFRPEGVSDPSEIKQWVAGLLFENKRSPQHPTAGLRGNEMIN